MAAPKIMHGARASVGVFDPVANQVQIIGSFSDVSYGVTYDVLPAYTLGRFSVAELNYTAMEPVTVTCSGFRAVTHGWHREARVPRLQDLLLFEPLTLTVIDRVTAALGGEARVATIVGCLPASGAGGFNARALSTMHITYIGALVNDESTQNSESVGSTSLP